MSVAREDLVPMRGITEGLACVDDALIAPKTQVYENRRYTEGSQFPRERNPIRELIVGVAADRDSGAEQSQCCICFVDCSPNPLVVLATSSRGIGLKGFSRTA